MSERSFDIKAYSQDPYGVAKEQSIWKHIKDMQTKELMNL
jgi:hypothetical protein